MRDLVYEHKQLAARVKELEAERDRLTAELAEEKQMHADVDAALKLEVDERDRLAKRVEELERERKTWG